MATAEIAQDLAMALDPVLLSESVGIYPDKWQRDFLRSSASRILLNCSRQAGKSTTTATLTLHTALYQPGSLSLVLSPAERQSKEFLRKVMFLYRALGRPVPADAENKLELELSNGSRIVALPGAEGTIRGYSGVDLLIIDEASRVDDTLYHSVRPMLAVSGGRLLGLSTPYGKRGWWYEAWADTKSDWQRFEVTALECPRITRAFIDEERRNNPEQWVQQEYFCQFVDTLTSVFSYDHVMAAMSDDVQPLFPVMEVPAWHSL